MEIKLERFEEKTTTAKSLSDVFELIKDDETIYRVSIIFDDGKVVTMVKQGTFPLFEIE